VAAADQALHREEGALGIGDRLALGWLADEAFAIVRKSNDRGRRSHALRVLNDLGSFAVHDGDARIGRAEVDTDDLSHDSILFSAAGWSGPDGAPDRTPRSSNTRDCGVEPHIGGGVVPARTVNILSP